MPTLKEAASRSVNHWAGRIEAELAKQEPDHADIHNSVLHLRQGLMLLGLSAESLPSAATREGTMELVQRARETLKQVME